MNKLIKFKKRLGAAYRAFKQPVAPLPNAPAKKTGSADRKIQYTPADNSYMLLNQKPVTIDDLKKEYCIGDGACRNVCPVDAIAMTTDKWGYFVPEIDNGKCVSCGKCVKACPVISTKHENTASPECYAVAADDETRKHSSSGGMFSLAANHILDNGGYVCGAAFDDDFSVKHIIISSKEELTSLCGSKYVQSNTGTVYTEIKKLLESGKTVLFSGCPCQVGGLYGFLGRSYDNLYTIDLVCHGAPSQMSFIKYLDEYYGRENMNGFRFRTKEFGYNSFNQTAYLKDGSQISGNIKFDPYEKAMHSGLALKDICADCVFAEAPRQGDITIGDFWGLSKRNPEYNDNLGTSVVLINNEKGKQLFEKARLNTKLCEFVPFDFARVNNRFGRKMRIPGGRRWYYTMLGGQSFKKSVTYALSRKFDIGVIGLWYGRNYGSMATYFALHQVLTEKLNLSVLMIDNPLGSDEKEAGSNPQKVAEKFYDVSKKYRLEDLHVLNANCDTFIVGSDQLWNVYLSRPYKQMYFLDFVADRNKKIAYGTSCGISYRGTEEEKIITSHFLKRFDSISVRDKMSHDILKDNFGIDNAEEVCDPTFLCPVEEYNKLSALAQQKEDDEFILAYILDPNENTGRQLEQLADEKNIKIVVVLDESPKSFEKNVEILNIEKSDKVTVKKDITLFDWIRFYQDARSIVTDSFHGTIFSIIFRKPFLTLKNVRRGAQRFISLLTPLGLIDRLFDDHEAITQNSSLLDALDYEQPAAELKKITDRSMEWLKNALYSKKQFSSQSVYQIEDIKK